MLDKIKILPIWFLFILNSAVYAQNDSEKICLSVEKLEILDNQIKFRLLLHNNGEKGFTIFKPYINNVCSGVLKIYLINSQTNIKHEVFPCLEIYDLGAIILNNRNCVYIDKNEGFASDYNINLKEITPYLIKGSYLFFVEYNLKDVYFKTDLEDVFQGDIISNRTEIEY